MTTTPPRRNLRRDGTRLALLSLPVLLAACGGGGGTDVTPPPPPDPPPPAAVAGLRCTGPKSTGWCWQAPQPWVPVIDDVVFTDSRNGWAVGDALLRTEDGGASWQERPTPGDAQLLAIRFASPDQGWLLSRHGGQLWRTLDAGRSWLATAPLPLDHATGLALFGQQSIGVNGLRARDGGRVPERFTLLSDDAASSWRASAAFVEPGYAESDGTLWSNLVGNGSFAQSTDGGRSFAAPQAWGTSRYVALFLSDGIATALGILQDGLTGAERWQVLQRQAPQGPWAPVDLPPIANGGSLQRLALFATGGWALSLGAVTQEAPLYVPQAPVTLWRREPGAQGWTASALPASVGRLGGYQLVDGRTAWLQPVDEAPWLSTDGGRSWARGFAPSADAADALQFVRRDGAGALLAGYAGGDDDNGNRTGPARWYRSTDDGRSWRALPGTGADGDRITGLWMFDGQRGLASTSGGRWLDTTTAGRDWVARPPAARLPGALQDLQFTPDGTGWVVGRVQQPADALGLRPTAAGELYRSADQGRSWAAVALPAAAAGRVTGVQFVDRQIGFLQAATRCDTVLGYSCNQQTYATRDAGVTWQAVGAEWPTAGLRLMVSATQGLWLPPWGRRAAPPVVITTSDGGATWSDSTVLPAGPDLAVSRVIAVGSRLWILGEDRSNGQGVLLSSSDGGRDWKAQTLPLPPDIAPRWLTGTAALRDIAFADDRHGWIVGRQGLVLATTDGGLTWVRQASGSRQTLVTVHAPSADTVWIGGTARSILATASGGR